MWYFIFMSESKEGLAPQSETTTEITFNTEGQPEQAIVIDSRANYEPLETYDDGFHDDPNAELIDDLSERNVVHFNKVRVEKNTARDASPEHHTTTGVLLYVAEGAATVEVDGVQYELSAGDQIAIPPESTYRTYSGEGGAARTLVSVVEESERTSLEESGVVVVRTGDIVPRPESEIVADPEVPDGDSRGGNQSDVKEQEDRLSLKKIKYNKNYVHPDEQGKHTKVELHLWRGETWTCLSGEMQLEVGGTMDQSFEKPPKPGEPIKEMRARSLSGAKHIALKPGMQVYVPPGMPHMHYTGPGKAAQVLFQRTHFGRVLSPDEAKGR